MTSDPVQSPQPVPDRAGDRPSSGVGRRGFLGGAAVLTGAALTSLPAGTASAAAAPAAPAAPVTSAAPMSAVAPDSSAPPNAVSLVPIRAGFVTTAVLRLDGVIKDLLKRTGVPGLAAAVVHDGKVVFTKAYGVRDLTTNQPTTVDTVFQLASVSKPLAGSVVARVVGQRACDWSDPIQKHLPGFDLSDRYVGSHVTIEDMLAHRSGLPGAAGDLLEDLGYDRDYILDHLRLEPLAPIRTRYAYSNFGFTSGAVAAAAATGKEWADLAETELFAPLGMTASSYRHADFAARPNRSAMHVRVDGVWKQAYARNADPEAPAGGGSSSVVDLARWLQLELANGVWNGQPFIDPVALARTHQPAITMGPVPPEFPYARSSFYAQGFDVNDDGAGRVRWSHSGAFFQGASTQVLMLPSANLGIVTLTNGMPIGLPESVGASFLDLVETGIVQRDWLAGYGALFAALMANTSSLAGKTPPTNPTPAHPDAFYVGTYQNAFYGPIAIESAGGSLHLRIGPVPRDYPLTHWDGDVFAYEPTGENAVGITSARFHPNDAGTQAGSVTLEYYDADGLGTFTRA